MLLLAAGKMDSCLLHLGYVSLLLSDVIEHAIGTVHGIRGVNSWFFFFSLLTEMEDFPHWQMF